jgi:hypothetical protein
MPEVMKLVEAARGYRLARKRTDTVKMDETPVRLSIENLPGYDAPAFPPVYSSRSKCIPIRF